MEIESCAGHKGDRGKKLTKLPKKICKRKHVPKRKFVKDVVVEVIIKSVFFEATFI